MSEVRAKLYGTYDVYGGLAPRHHQGRPPGWGGDHEIFAEMVVDADPRLIVEIGSWLGQSAVTLARAAHENADGNVEVVCVDTWCGSMEHWTRRRDREQLRLENGRPTVYDRFVRYVVAAGFSHIVTPMPMPSAQASRLFARWRLEPQLIYVDGSHHEEDVAQDIYQWWPLLARGGVMFGHDFSRWWPGVKRAVRENLPDVEERDPYWVARKS